MYNIDTPHYTPYIPIVYILYTIGIDVPPVNNPRVHERFYGLHVKNQNGRLGKEAVAVARFNDNENDCRFEVQREEHWIYTRPTWSITVRARLLELFCG